MQVKSRSYLDLINEPAENITIEFSSVSRTPCWGLQDAAQYSTWPDACNEVINSWGHQCASKSRGNEIHAPNEL